MRFHTGKAAYTKEEVSKAEAEGKPLPPFLQKQCETDYKLGKWETTADGGLAWTWFNKYTTSIHVLNSAIIKVSKLTAAVPVYRGISGASLPKQLIEEDPITKHRGGVECACPLCACSRAVVQWLLERVPSPPCP